MATLTEEQFDQEMPDCVIQLIEGEIGGDLKSLKKVKGLLEKLTAENILLEEQVMLARLMHITSTSTPETTLRCTKGQLGGDSSAALYIRLHNRPLPVIKSVLG